MNRLAFRPFFHASLTRELSSSKIKIQSLTRLLQDPAATTGEKDNCRDLIKKLTQSIEKNTTYSPTPRSEDSTVEAHIRQKPHHYHTISRNGMKVIINCFSENCPGREPKEYYK